MTKQEFLERLKTSLQDEVSSRVLQENLRYYDDYIAAEVRNGRTESDVIAEIGDPRLIARTIIDTTAGSGSVFDSEPQTDTDYSQEGSGYSRTVSGRNIRYYDFNKWYVKLAAVVLAVLIVILLLAIISGLLSLLVPLLPVVGVVIFLMWVLQKPHK